MSPRRRSMATVAEGAEPRGLGEQSASYSAATWEMDDARAALRSREEPSSVAARKVLSRWTYQRTSSSRQACAGSWTLPPSRTQAFGPTTAVRSSLCLRPGLGTDPIEARQGGGSSRAVSVSLLIAGVCVEERLGGIRTARDLQRGSLEAGRDDH
jgi:hypothetical protein